MSDTSLIEAALSKVNDPELHRSITELGMVESISQSGSDVQLKILLTISGCPMRDRLTKDIEAATLAVDGVKTVSIEFGVMNEEQRANIKKLLRNGREAFIPFAQKDSLTRVMGVPSVKAGVGKSSLTATIAVAAAP